MLVVSNPRLSIPLTVWCLNTNPCVEISCFARGGKLSFFVESNVVDWQMWGRLGTFSGKLQSWTHKEHSFVYAGAVVPTVVLKVWKLMRDKLLLFLHFNTWRPLPPTDTFWLVLPFLLSKMAPIDCHWPNLGKFHWPTSWVTADLPMGGDSPSYTSMQFLPWLYDPQHYLQLPWHPSDNLPSPFEPTGSDPIWPTGTPRWTRGNQGHQI